MILYSRFNRIWLTLFVSECDVLSSSQPTLSPRLFRKMRTNVFGNADQENVDKISSGSFYVEICVSDTIWKFGNKTILNNFFSFEDPEFLRLWRPEPIFLPTENVCVALCTVEDWVSFLDRGCQLQKRTRRVQSIIWHIFPKNTPKNGHWCVYFVTPTFRTWIYPWVDPELFTESGKF